MSIATASRTLSLNRIDLSRGTFTIHAALKEIQQQSTVTCVRNHTVPIEDVHPSDDL